MSCFLLKLAKSEMKVMLSEDFTNHKYICPNPGPSNGHRSEMPLTRKAEVQGGVCSVVGYFLCKLVL